MTKKDYELIAKTIRDYREDGRARLTDVDELSAKMAMVFATDNPRFHAGRFLEACDHSVTYREKAQ